MEENYDPPQLHQVSINEHVINEQPLIITFLPQEIQEDTYDPPPLPNRVSCIILSY